MALPFETIYPDTSAQIFLDWVNEVLFPASVNISSNDLLLQIKLFPNPASKAVNIQLIGVDFLAICSIYCSDGRKVLPDFGVESENPTTIDVSALPAGLYFLRIFGEQYSASRQLLIVH